MVKICPKCGIKADANAKFCKICGSKLIEKEEPTVDKATDFISEFGGETLKKLWEDIKAAFKHIGKEVEDEQDEETEQARRITAPQPLPDEMLIIKKLYLIMWICIGIGLFIKPLMLIGIIGLIANWLLDYIMVEYYIMRLQNFKFLANNDDITDDAIFIALQSSMLAKYGIYVNRGNMGQAVITINGFSYTIVLNADYTFCIHSEASFRRKLPHIGSERKAEYNYYREMLGAMGTIAYEIQSQFHIVPKMGSEQSAYTYSQQGMGKSRMNQSGMGAQTQGFSSQGGPTPGWQSQRAEGNWTGRSYNFGWSPITNKKTNWLAVASSVLMILGVFLPFATASVFGVTSSQTLIDGGDGWFFLGIAIIAIILGLLGKNTGVLAMGIIAVLLIIFEINDLSKIAQENEFGYLLERGSGFYLTLLSTIGLTIAGIYGKMTSRLH